MRLIKGILVIIFCFLNLIAVKAQAWSRADITIQNNGYEGIVIAIHKDIPEDEDIIKYLKDIFTQASYTLYQTTKHRLYFQNITILVPLTWEPRPIYEAATDETFDRANIRVDKPHPANGNAPYVQQVEGCGKAGEYLHLTPEYIVNRQQSDYFWGPAGKTVIHEWGHLRWGLFDEYAVSEEGNDHFYVDKNRLHPVRCNNKVKGWPMNMKTQGPCAINRKTLQVEKECRFVPDMNGNKARASFMFMQFLDTVQEFCDNLYFEDNEIIHNPNAPNGQNMLCGGRSTWEILRNHTDFKNLYRNENVNPTPNFKFVRQGYHRNCLVMDVSGSMDSDTPTRLESLRQAAQKYILTTIQNGSFIALVEFTGDARITQTLTEIKDKQSRQDAVNNLPKNAGGGTSIQNGILKGLEALKYGKFGVQKGGRIMLITDGQAPPFDYAIDKAKKQGVIIDTIAISNYADRKLQEAAIKTGGFSFYYSPNTGSTQLNDGMDKIADRDFIGIGNAPITVKSEYYVVSPNATNNYDHFTIDNSLTDTGILTFSYDTEIDVSIIDPTGKTLSDSELQTQKDKTFKTITMTLKSPVKVGQWTYRFIVKTQDAKINVNIRSTPKSSTKDVTIMVSSSIDAPDINFNSKSVVKIFASVTKGYMPVIGAIVKATVGRPIGSDFVVDLLDNGVGSDIKKNDGIYSGSFVPKNFNGNGHYSIKVNVKNNGKSTNVQSRATGSGAMGIPGRYIPPTTSGEKIETGEFDRITSGGTFQVVNFNQNVANQDKLAPSRISDLKAISIDIQNFTMTLQWTAVGDDADQGTAHLYSLRVSQNTTSLKHPKGFAESEEVQDILIGSLKNPKEPGNTEKITISTQKQYLRKGEDFYFAIAAQDKAGNIGEPSNLVYVATEMPDISFLDEKPPSGVNIPLIVGLTVGGIFLIAVAVGSVFYYKHKKSKVLPV